MTSNHGIDRDYNQTKSVNEHSKSNKENLKSIDEVKKFDKRNTVQNNQCDTVENFHVMACNYDNKLNHLPIIKRKFGNLKAPALLDTGANLSQAS